MSDLPYIRCMGCEMAVFDPTRAVCPGCGRCPVCGKKRFKTEAESCPECNLPYCDCCGRCPKCAQLRYSDIVTPCECGHPEDPDLLEDLTQYEAAVGARSRPIEWGCLIGSLILIGVFLLIIYALTGFR